MVGYRGRKQSLLSPEVLMILSKQNEALKLPAKDVWGVLMPKDSPLAEKEFISPEDLWGQPLLFIQLLPDKYRISAGNVVMDSGIQLFQFSGSLCQQADTICFSGQIPMQAWLFSSLLAGINRQQGADIWKYGYFNTFLPFSVFRQPLPAGGHHLFLRLQCIHLR